MGALERSNDVQVAVQESEGRAVAGLLPPSVGIVDIHELM